MPAARNQQVNQRPLEFSHATCLVFLYAGWLGSKDASFLIVDLPDLTIRYRPQLSAFRCLSQRDVWNGLASPLVKAEQHRPIRAEAVVCTTLLMGCSGAQCGGRVTTLLSKPVLVQF